MVPYGVHIRMVSLHVYWISAVLFRVRFENLVGKVMNINDGVILYSIRKLTHICMTYLPGIIVYV